MSIDDLDFDLSPMREITTQVPVDESTILIHVPTVFFAKLVDAIRRRIGVEIALTQDRDGSYDTLFRRAPGWVQR